MRYFIETSNQGRKYVRVGGEYTIYLYADRIEVEYHNKVIEIIDFMVVDTTKTERFNILKETIKEYHFIEPCPL